MNAMCIDKDVKFKKKCPYRVITEEHKAILRGQGDVTTQLFYPCIGEECIAYHVGICLRAYEALNKLQESEKK